MKKKNMLSRLQSRKVEDIVLEYKDQIERGDYDMVSFTKHCEKVLDFEVTVPNIKTSALTIGVKFVRNSKINGPGKTAARIQYLAKELARLEGELGYPIPPELQAIAGGE